ncbi:DUF368 domain-containing protein [Salinibius halmophilus]|uniref:DUF368 domain-containing protein n=1 Tax=Salinibius halmophilus TaxID=1853216 RepID=UPI0018F79008|nr:DUF368 domain-containing protein [Salinibius halmophilus]
MTTELKTTEAMTWAARITVALKGAAMGAADVVPGVSGGTLAFILGIYERLIAALSQVDGNAIKMLLQFDIKGLWLKFDGAFLLPLFVGILTSIFTIAHGVSWMLVNQPVLLWSLFNGLIILSLPIFVSSIKWQLNRVALTFFGVVLAAAVNFISGNISDPTLWQVFLAGAIAISALLLPGISGSFILLLLGMYEPVIGAVKSLELVTLIVFALGCLTGMLSTSKLIAYFLKRHHDAMIALLLGVIIGALYRIWPWQIEGNPVSWQAFSDTGADLQLTGAVLFFIVGGAIMLMLQRVEQRR